MSEQRDSEARAEWTVGGPGDTWLYRWEAAAGAMLSAEDATRVAAALNGIPHLEPRHLETLRDMREDYARAWGWRDFDTLDAAVKALRAPAPDTPEVAERSEKCPTCGGAVDDPGYDEINAGDQTGRDYCPDPFHTPESSDPDRYGETGGGEAPERADDPTDHSGEQAAGAGRESRAAISSEQRNCFAPVSSEEDRARGLDTRFIGLSVVAHTGDGPIQGVIVDYDDYAAEIRSGAMHERVTWPCLYWPKDEAREPAKWDDRGSACGGARPVSSEEDRSMVRRWHRIGLYDAPQIRAILTDATTLAQYAKGEGRVMGEARVCEACGEPATATVETFFADTVHYFCAEHDLNDLDPAPTEGADE